MGRHSNRFCVSERKHRGRVCRGTGQMRRVELGRLETLFAIQRDDFCARNFQALVAENLPLRRQEIRESLGRGSFGWKEAGDDTTAFCDMDFLTLA